MDHSFDSSVKLLASQLEESTVRRETMGVQRLNIGDICAAILLHAGCNYISSNVRWNLLYYGAGGSNKQQTLSQLSPQCGMAAARSVCM